MGRLVISVVVVVLRLSPTGLPLALAPESTNYKVIKGNLQHFSNFVSIDRVCSARAMITDKSFNSVRYPVRTKPLHR